MNESGVLTRELVSNINVGIPYLGDTTRYRHCGQVSVLLVADISSLHRYLMISRTLPGQRKSRSHPLTGSCQYRPRVFRQLRQHENCSKRGFNTAFEAYDVARLPEIVTTTAPCGVLPNLAGKRLPVAFLSSC
jgi:hypothetical protein